MVVLYIMSVSILFNIIWSLYVSMKEHEEIKKLIESQTEHLIDYIYKNVEK